MIGSVVELILGAFNNHVRGFAMMKVPTVGCQCLMFRTVGGYSASGSLLAR